MDYHLPIRSQIYEKGWVLETINVNYIARKYLDWPPMSEMAKIGTVFTHMWEVIFFILIRVIKFSTFFWKPLKISLSESNTAPNVKQQQPKKKILQL